MRNQDRSQGLRGEEPGDEGHRGDEGEGRHGEPQGDIELDCLTSESKVSERERTFTMSSLSSGLKRIWPLKDQMLLILGSAERARRWA